MKIKYPRGARRESGPKSAGMRKGYFFGFLGGGRGPALISRITYRDYKREPPMRLVERRNYQGGNGKKYREGFPVTIPYALDLGLPYAFTLSVCLFVLVSYPQ